MKKTKPKTLSETPAKQASSPARDGSIVRIDLHGLTRDKAEKHIIDTFKIYENRFSLCTLYIITGRGKHSNRDGRRAVLFNWLPTWLKTCKFKDRICQVTPGVGVYEVTLNASPRQAARSVSQGRTQNFLMRLATSAADITALKQSKHKSPEEYSTLGCYLIVGIYVDKNVSLGIQYLSIAAKNNYLPAIESLSAYYNKGILGCLKPNPKKAATLAQRALEMGTQNADLMQLILAGGRTLGRGLKQDDKKAFERLKDASQLGNPQAQFSLAVLYLDGETFSNGFSVQQDFVKAHQLLMSAAKQGMHEAYRKIAILYTHGRGVEKNLSKAFQWYKKGAEIDDVFCIYNVSAFYLGDMGAFGEPINTTKGMVYLKQAAALGDEDAELELGKCFFRGRNIANNLSEAHRLFESAKKHENPRAYYWVAMMAVLNNKRQEAMVELKAGLKHSCPMSKALQQQLRRWQWFEKNEKERSDAVLNMMNQPEKWLTTEDSPWLRENDAILPIFGQIAVAGILDNLKTVDPNKFCHQQPSLGYLQLKIVFLYHTGIAKHHEVMLNLQCLCVLAYLNQGLIEKADKVLKQSILPNLLDLHTDNQKTSVKKLQRYILQIQVAKKFLQSDKLSKALNAFEKALSVFTLSDVEYFLLNPSMAWIHTKIEDIHQQTKARNDTPVLLPIFSIAILEYLKSLSNVLGTVPNNLPLVEIHEKQGSVSFLSFWLRQLGSHAINEITTTLRVNDKMLFGSGTRTSFFDKPSTEARPETEVSKPSLAHIPIANEFSGI